MANEIDGPSAAPTSYDDDFAITKYTIVIQTTITMLKDARSLPEDEQKQALGVVAYLLKVASDK